MFVLDRYEGYDVRLVHETPAERARARGSRRTRAAVREQLPADLVFTNHVLLGGPVGLASGAPFAVKAHGSELEYSMRGRPELEAWGAEALAHARATFVGSEHIRTVLAEVCGPVERVHEVPPGVDVDLWRPERARATRSRRCSRRRGATRRTRATARSACPTRATRSGWRRSSPATRPTVVYFGKLIEQKGVHVLLDALAGLDARVVVVGFGPERARLEALAAEHGVRALFTGPLEHRHLRHLLAFADACVVPSVFPEAFGMVAAEAAAAGCPPIVARHSGLAEVAADLEAALPPSLARARRLPDRRRRRRSASGCAALLALPGLRPRDAARRPCGASPRSAGAGRGSRGGCST